MRAATQAPSPSPAVRMRGQVYRRPPPASSLASLVTPSPSSSSSASSSSGSSSSYSATARSRASSRGAPVAPSPAPPTDDDSDRWASMRLASSPPKVTRQSEYTSSFATLLQPTASQHQHHQPHQRQSSYRQQGTDDAAMLPLVIDDFSQDRMGRVPTRSQTSPPAPPLAQQPKSSSWSIGRRRHKAETSPAPPLARAHSLNTTETLATAVAPQDITLMDHRVFVSRDQWVPHRDRRACVVCDRDFGMLRKKHSCRMCGDVVCSRCSLFKNVKLPGVVGESKARVCSRCFLQYRQRVGVTTPPVDDMATRHHEPKPHPCQDDDQGHDCDHDHDHDYDEPQEHSDDECMYDAADALPTVEDVMRRTAAKVTGARLPVAPVAPADFGGRRTHHTPVSLLAPEIMDAMYRESSTISAAAALSRQNANHIYGRGPSMVLLSPASSYDLLDMQLFDLDHTQSFSSTISTVSSSLSSSSMASTVSSARSATEEELAAAIKARELEKEVEASRQRIQELESKMEEQENKKAELSLEQQKQLSEARELIAQLQAQLKQQEQNARNAAMQRDSICLTNLRQMQQAQLAVPEMSASQGPRTQRSNSVEAESEALRQKLRLLERQLQHAGINVAEVIPYAVAKQRIIEISRRMAEISDAEETMKQQNPKGVVALRREYYVLEQEMERFHTALLMSDEYIEEQATKDREWEQGHALANAQALRTVRSALPVDISRLSEQTLRSMVTPSGKHMSADLARRFKRTNVLQLLRVSPQTIVRMHPSVIESYRTAGLTLLERRALHAALKAPASEWQRQAREENAQKKFAWFKKLKDAFVHALLAYEQHIVKHHMGKDAQCPFIGKMCVVRGEQAVAQLYAAQLGFPEGDEYLQQEIVKSDPEGAGEKALVEAKAHAHATATLSARQSDLRTHYGMRNVRLVTMALAALEEIDAARERLLVLDAKAAGLVHSGLMDEHIAAQWWGLCRDLVHEVRELTLHLARRAGICLTGKRDRSKDAVDTRSCLEVRASYAAVCFMDAIADDVAVTIAALVVPASAVQLKNALPRIRELLVDVQDKNDALLFSEEPLRRTLTPVVEVDAEEDGSDHGNDPERASRLSRETTSLSSLRVPWKERKPTTPATPAPVSNSSSIVKTADVSPPSSPRRMRTPPMLPRGSILLDAIRAKRTVVSDAADESSDEARMPMPAPVTPVTPVTPVAVTPVPMEIKKAIDTAPKANDLFAAIRAKRSAMSDAGNEPARDVAEPIVASPVGAVTTSVSVSLVTTAAVVTMEDAQTTDEAPKATNLLALIRARKAKANAMSAATSVEHAVVSA